jgi:hypothetical protein
MERITPLTSLSRFDKIEGEEVKQATNFIPIDVEARNVFDELPKRKTPTDSHQLIIPQRRFDFERIKAWANVPQEYRIPSGVLKAAKKNRLDILKDLIASKNELVLTDYRHPRTGETAWDIAVRTGNAQMQDILGLPKKYDGPTGASDAIKAGDYAALRLWLASGRSLDENFYQQHHAWQVKPQAPWTYGISKSKFDTKTGDLSNKYVFAYRNKGTKLITRNFDPKTGLMTNGTSVFEFMATLDKRRAEPN